jgi:hypothetical protein
MTRIGLTPDELLLATWSGGAPPSYAASIPGLNVLTGETVALVGSGREALLDRLGEVLPACLPIDGAVAAAGGALRVHAQQAARVGVKSLVVSDPFTGLGDEARSLAVADLAGLANLGLTTVVATADATLAALGADRVCIVRDGSPQVAYPVLAPTPRSLADVAPVTDRLATRLSAG